MLAIFQKNIGRNGRIWCDVFVRVFLLLVFVYVLDFNTHNYLQFTHLLLILLVLNKQENREG